MSHEELSPEEQRLEELIREVSILTSIPANVIKLSLEAYKYDVLDQFTIKGIECRKDDLIGLDPITISIPYIGTLEATPADDGFESFSWLFYPSYQFNKDAKDAYFRGKDFLLPNMIPNFKTLFNKRTQSIIQDTGDYDI